jgi:RNA polymerase sigma-70 factor (ECF subfamily)
VNRQMQGYSSHADDIFQQTWMRAIDNLATYRDQEKFSAWLMRIAHNLIIDYYRSLKRRAEDELDDSYGDTTMDSSGETPGSAMDEQERARKLAEALNSLTPELREVFLLRRENIPFQQIAKIQNCSVNTSLARMRYAIKQLANKLKDWESDNS